MSLAGTGAGTVTGPGINCPGDCTEVYPTGTVVALNAPPASPPPTVFKQWTGDCTGTSPSCTVTMNANRNVVAHFELIRTLTVIGGALGSDVAGSVTSNPAGITCTWPPGQVCTDTAPYPHGTVVTLTAVLGPGGTRVAWGGDCTGATGNVCTLPMDADKTVHVDTFRLFQPDKQAAFAPLEWSTQLQVPDGEGQVVMNGSIASGVGAGITAMTAGARTGTNRVEAVLVRGAGRPGTWRFDFSGQPSFRSGSLRVVAGTVSLVTADVLLFRVQGNPGERVVFTFEAAP